MCTYRPINSYLLPNDPIGKYRLSCCKHASFDYSRDDDSFDNLKRVLYRLEDNSKASVQQIREAENIIRKIDYQENRKDMLDYDDKNEIRLEISRLKYQLDDLRFSVDASMHHRANSLKFKHSKHSNSAEENHSYDEDFSDYDDVEDEEGFRFTGHRSRKNSFKEAVDSRTGSVYHLNCHQSPFDASYNNNNVAFLRSKSFEKLPAERNLKSRSPSPMRRYFKAKKAGDLRPGDWVKFKRRSMNNTSSGQVKYVGHLPGKSDIFIGVELYKEAGKNSGKVNGFEYFKCKPNSGIFVPFEKILQAWKYTS